MTRRLSAYLAPHVRPFFFFFFFNDYPSEPLWRALTHSVGQQRRGREGEDRERARERESARCVYILYPTPLGNAQCTRLAVQGDPSKLRNRPKCLLSPLLLLCVSVSREHGTHTRSSLFLVVSFCIVSLPELRIVSERPGWTSRRHLLLLLLLCSKSRVLVPQWTARGKTTPIKPQTPRPLWRLTSQSFG